MGTQGNTPRLRPRRRSPGCIGRNGRPENAYRTIQALKKAKTTNPLILLTLPMLPVYGVVYAGYIVFLAATAH